MKTLLLILILAGCGCRALDKKIVQRSDVQLMQSQQGIAPATTLYRMAWQPGGYSNFVVFASEQILVPVLQWPVYTITTETNFVFDASLAPQKFFTLYGTNDETGESAWLTK